MLLTNISSWYFDSDQQDWELILDIPFRTDLLDQVNGVSADITNSTYCSSSQYRATLDTTNQYLIKTASTHTQYKNVVYIDLSSTSYPTKISSASKLKIEFNVYSTYISGSGSNQYVYPFAFGAMSSSTNVGNALLGLSISNNTSNTGSDTGRYTLLNTWYTMTYEIDLSTGDCTVSNGTNTTSYSTSITSSNLQSNSEYINKFTIFPKRWSSPNSWAGRFRDLKIYAK